MLFLLCLFFAPLASVVPSYATAPALLYVAGLMMRELVEVEWNDITNAIPAALTAIIMPFTYSIAEGIAFGFISYVVIKVFTGRFRDIHIATFIIALLVVLGFPPFLHENGSCAP